jgi:hypothetical protein
MDFDLGTELIIYDECLQKTIDNIKHFYIVQNLIINFKTGKYTLPKNHELKIINYMGYKYFVSKNVHDPFSITYSISFSITKSNFNKVFGSCMEKHDIKFDYDTWENIKELLQDFSILISDKIGFDNVLIDKGKKIEIQIRFYLTNPKKLILD